MCKVFRLVLGTQKAIICVSAVITCYAYRNAKAAGEYGNLKVKEERRIDLDSLERSYDTE